MDLTENRVYYEHDANCTPVFKEPNDHGIRQCLECAGFFDKDGKGVAVTDKRFDERYNPNESTDT